MSIIVGKKNIKPFLKWAGGKRWFVRNYNNLIPKNFNRYIEPFLGSGAVFFHLQPNEAILGDINQDLIESYRSIKENWHLVFKELQDHHKKHSKEYYYKIRNTHFDNTISQAARFIYLNRTCWNGLYRVNLKGKFNVPIGTKSSVIFDDDNFEIISKLLEKTELYSSDFEAIINKAQRNDLLYIDPPYTVRHNNNAFIKYNEKLFSWDDQKRLFNALKRAKAKGAKIVVTNACHESIKELYKNNFTFHKVSRTSLISSKVDSRKKFEELVIFNGDSI